MAQADDRDGAFRGALLDVIVETAPDAIITIDADGLILSFSAAAERMFGFTEPEVVGQNVRCLMPQPFHDQHDQYLQRYLETGEKRVIGIGREVRAQRKNGEIFVAELAVGEFFEGDERIFAGFLRDITDRVEAQRKAERLQRMLDRVSRIQLLGEMATALAHEINQPLTAISNFARAARHSFESDAPDMAKCLSYLDQIAAEAQRTGEIVKRMRGLIDRGQPDCRPENINEIVREAIQLSHTGAPYGGLVIELNLADDLPPVLVDRVQIQQVIVNLLRNAAEAMAGEDDQEVHISTVQMQAPSTIKIRALGNANGQVCVTVADGGGGLPNDLVERMFEPFMTTKPTGLGIGLAVCRTIVQAHGGRIWADNNPAGGAEIHFTLPIARHPAEVGIAEAP